MIGSPSVRAGAPLAVAGALFVLVVARPDGTTEAAPTPTPTPPAASVPAGVTAKDDGARWESGYGEKFFQVVGTVTNGSSASLGAVRIRTELLDPSGKVVATFDGWNARAEALGDLGDDAARAELAVLAPGPLEPGTSDRFRATFLADETPPFSTHRIRVVTALPPS